MTPARTPISSERGASLAEFTLVLALILVIVIIAVTFFGEDDSADDTEPPIPVATVVEIEYRGETLHCIDFEHTPAVGGDSAACDFERFYVEHPELLEPMSLKSDGATEN